MEFLCSVLHAKVQNVRESASKIITVCFSPLRLRTRHGQRSVKNSEQWTICIRGCLLPSVHYFFYLMSKLVFLSDLATRWTCRATRRKVYLKDKFEGDIWIRLIATGVADDISGERNAEEIPLS